MYYVRASYYYWYNNYLQRLELLVEIIQYISIKFYFPFSILSSYVDIFSVAAIYVHMYLFYRLTH